EVRVSRCSLGRPGGKDRRLIEIESQSTSTVTQRNGMSSAFCEEMERGGRVGKGTRSVVSRDAERSARVQALRSASRVTTRYADFAHCMTSASACSNCAV